MMIDIVPNAHPMLVHFALALPLSATLFYTLAWTLPRRAFAPGATTAAHWTLGLGVAFLWLSVGSGMWAAIQVTMDAAGEQAVSLHQYWGWGTAVLYTLAVAAQTSLGAGPRRVRALVLLICIAGAGSAAVTGYLGAENVYRHGIGVERLPAMPTP